MDKKEKSQLELVQTKEEEAGESLQVEDSEQNEWVEKLAHLENELKESRHQTLLARADLENFRRRTRKEVEERFKYAAVPLLESLLPVVDNLERAWQIVESKDDASSAYVASIGEGLEMVYKQLTTVLTQAGLDPIQAVDQPFDPHQHHAVMQVEGKGDTPSGIVIEELQKGYRYLDRVIRPAMVKVSS